MGTSTIPLPRDSNKAWTATHPKCGSIIPQNLTAKRNLYKLRGFFFSAGYAQATTSTSQPRPSALHSATPRHTKSLAVVGDYDQLIAPIKLDYTRLPYG